MTANGGTLAVVGKAERKQKLAGFCGIGGPVRCFGLLPGPARLTRLVFSLDGGALLAGVGVDLTVTLWDTSTGKVTGICRGHQRFIHNVAFHPKEKLLLSWGDDGTVRHGGICPIASRSAGIMLGHNRAVSVAAYSTLGTWIASGGDDGRPFAYGAENGG